MGNTCTCKSVLKDRAFQKEQTDCKSCGWTVFTSSLIGKLEETDSLPIKKKKKNYQSYVIERFLLDSRYICKFEIVSIVSGDLGHLFNQSFFSLLSYHRLIDIGNCIDYLKKMLREKSCGFSCLCFQFVLTSFYSIFSV